MSSLKGGFQGWIRLSNLIALQLTCAMLLECPMGHILVLTMLSLVVSSQMQIQLIWQNVRCFFLFKYLGDSQILRPSQYML